jgi:hypothetical protein
MYAALYTPQAPKSAAAVPEPQKVPEPIFWVKCDECDRWRIINGLTHEEQTKLMKKSWFCRMHPDAAQRECDKVVSCAVMGMKALDACDPRARRSSEARISAGFRVGAVQGHALAQAGPVLSNACFYRNFCS